MKVWGPQWQPKRRKSGEDGHVASKLGDLGRSLAASWAVLGDVGSKMEPRNDEERHDEPQSPKVGDFKGPMPHMPE